MNGKQANTKISLSLECKKKKKNEFNLLHRETAVFNSVALHCRVSISFKPGHYGSSVNDYIYVAENDAQVLPGVQLVKMRKFEYPPYLYNDQWSKETSFCTAHGYFFSEFYPTEFDLCRRPCIPFFFFFWGCASLHWYLRRICCWEVLWFKSQTLLRILIENAKNSILLIVEVTNINQPERPK